MGLENPVILLVEDCDSDALLIEQAFRKARVLNPIFRVSNGADAVAYLRHQRQFADQRSYPDPVFLLLDLRLPDISGYELLRWIRRTPAGKELPVVMVTEQGGEGEEEAAIAAGANAFFRKQIEFSSLVEMVRSIGAYWNLRTAS